MLRLGDRMYSTAAEQFGNATCAGGPQGQQGIAPPVRAGDRVTVQGTSAEGATRAVAGAGPAGLWSFRAVFPRPHGRGYYLPALRALGNVTLSKQLPIFYV